MSILVLLGLALGVAPALARADDTVDFETPTLAAATLVTNQFQDRPAANGGVVFPSPPGTPYHFDQPLIYTADAHSGTHSLETPDPSAEFDIPGIEASFPTTRKTVSVYAKNITSPADTAQVKLQLLNGSTPDGASGGFTAVATGGGWILLTATTSSGVDDATGFWLETDGSSAENGQELLVDDLSMDHPASPPPPRFDISPAVGGFSVVHQGQSTDVGIQIERHNGESGPVSFTVSGLPSGVTAGVHPNPTGASDTSATITFMAAADAPTETSPTNVTVSATAMDTGPNSSTTTVPIEVRETCVDPSYSVLHVTGCWQPESAHPGVFDPRRSTFSLNGIAVQASDFQIDQHAGELRSSNASLYTVAGGVQLYGGFLDWHIPSTAGANGYELAASTSRTPRRTC